jgi:ABC-2 type transport system permease protein
MSLATDDKSDRGDTSAPATVERRSPFGHALTALGAIIGHDAARFGRHPGYALAGLFVPLLLLVVVPAGFNGVFGRALDAPYDTYVSLSGYILPGALALTLFLTVVPLMLTLLREHDADAVSLLFAVPLPRWYLAFARVVSAALLATIQAIVFIIVAWLIGSDIELVAWLVTLPAAILAAFMLAAAALLLLVLIRQLRRLSMMLLFIILPAFLLSSALYPPWKFTDFGADWLHTIVEVNPFTHAAELIRYVSEGQLTWISLAVVVGVGIVAFVGAMVGLNPRFGLLTPRHRARGWPEPVAE